MENLVQKFEKKYDFNPITFVEEVGVEYFGVLKTIGLEQAFESFAEKKGYKIPERRTNEFELFLKALIEAMQEAGVKFPQNQKVTIDGGEEPINLVVSPLASVSIPKSKGVLEDFKEIVSFDDLRPNMQGVYVDGNKLVATDGHKLIVFENSDFKSDDKKIIEMKTYLGTKGAKKNYIDGIYPKYEVVIPQNYDKSIKGVDLLALYSFVQSCIAIKKLQTSDVFLVRLKLGDTEIAFNPIILHEALSFLLAKGFDKATIEYDTGSKAVLIKVGAGDNLALIMPIYAKDIMLGTRQYTIQEIEEIFGKSYKKPTVKKAQQKSQPKKSTKNLVYTKFKGSINDTTYIPRRNIVSILLKNGEEIAGNEIIDGVYKIK